MYYIIYPTHLAAQMQQMTLCVCVSLCFNQQVRFEGGRLPFTPERELSTGVNTPGEVNILVIERPDDAMLMNEDYNDLSSPTPTPPPAEPAAPTEKKKGKKDKKKKDKKKKKKK